MTVEGHDISGNSSVTAKRDSQSQYRITDQSLGYVNIIPEDLAEVVKQWQKDELYNRLHMREYSSIIR